jgi:hypothetical protein
MCKGSASYERTPNTEGLTPSGATHVTQSGGKPPHSTAGLEIIQMISGTSFKDLQNFIQ